MERTYSTEHVDWTAVAGLFAEVGWGQRDPAQIRAAFEKSSHVMFIHEGGELIAFGRTMDDGCYYGMLVDVVVKPGRQQAGLGREIVSYLREKLDGYKFITLTAAGEGRVLPEAWLAAAGVGDDLAGFGAAARGARTRRVAGFNGA